MKTETEIRAKLRYYQEMLAGFTAARNIEVPETFLTVEQISPGQGLAALHLTAEMGEAIGVLPPEDQQWFRFTCDYYTRHMQGFLEDRISVLKWTLDENGVIDGGGGEV